jgi:hypothetical protein
MSVARSLLTEHFQVTYYTRASVVSALKLEGYVLRGVPMIVRVSSTHVPA